MLKERITFLKLTTIIALVVIIGDSNLIYSTIPVIRNYSILLLVILVATSFLIISIKRIHSELIFIIISCIILIIYYLWGFGDERLLLTIKFLFYSFAFYILGYRIGLYKLTIFKNIIINFTFLFYTIIIVLAFLNLSSSAIFNVGRDTLTKNITNDEDIHTGIMMWPFIFQILNLGLFNVFIYYKNPLIRIIVVLISILFIISIFFSTFSAVVVMLLMSIFFYFIAIYYFEIIKGKTKKINKFFIVVMALGIFIMIIVSARYVFSGSFGDMGGSANEISQIVNPDFSNVNDDKYDEITNGRWSNMLLSLEGFLNSPFTGSGAFYNTSFAGGHSFIFDTLSYFGLLGAIPIFLIYISFLINAWKFLKLDNMKSKESYFILAYLISTFTIFISSTFNPYLLHSTIDFFMFFGGGYISGLIDFKLVKLNIL